MTRKNRSLRGMPKDGFADVLQHRANNFITPSAKQTPLVTVAHCFALNCNFPPYQSTRNVHTAIYTISFAAHSFWIRLHCTLFSNCVLWVNSSSQCFKRKGQRMRLNSYRLTLPHLLARIYVQFKLLTHYAANETEQQCHYGCNRSSGVRFENTSRWLIVAVL